jgi:hypothetical protein
MTRTAATRRPGLLTLAIVAILVVAGLVVAGLQTIPARTESIRVPDSGTAGIAGPSHRLCEGPLQTPARASGVGVFADRATGTPTIAIGIFAGGRQIAAGRRTPDASVREQIVALDHPIPAGRPVQVCVGATGGTLTVYGAGAQAADVVAHGVNPGMQFSLVLTRSSTLIGSLSTAFSRAAIFRPSWVGAWTFWLLVGLLACTLPLAWVAISRALNDPEPDENSHAPDASS